METFKIPKTQDVDFERLQREAKEASANADTGANEKDMKKLERQELDMMTGKGAKYTLRYIKKVGIFRKRIKPVVQNFTIQQPTLAILDEMSRIAIDLELDEAAIKEGGLSTLQAARVAVRKNALKTAQIIALATLGETAYDISMVGNRVSRRMNRRKIQNLTALIYNTATPEQISEMAAAITNISNLGAFINSTRLMSARTTAPRTELVE